MNDALVMFMAWFSGFAVGFNVGVILEIKRPSKKDNTKKEDK